MSARAPWAKRAGKLVLLLLLAELLFFFALGLRLRHRLEGEREFLGAASPAGAKVPGTSCSSA